MFILFPTRLLKDSEESISLLRVIGCGAFALGTLSFFMLELTDKKALKPGLIALSIFHTKAAVALLYSFSFTNGTANIPAIIAHSLFAVSFIGVCWQRIR